MKNKNGMVVTSLITINHSVTESISLIHTSWITCCNNNYLLIYVAIIATTPLVLFSHSISQDILNTELAVYSGNIKYS